MTERLTPLDVMRDAPVIPVIVLNDVKDAVPLARALVAGGIRMLEVTLRTPQALQCIEAIAKSRLGVRRSKFDQRLGQAQPVGAHRDAAGKVRPVQG